MEEQSSIVDKIRILANDHGYSLYTLEAKLSIGNGTIGRWNKSSPNTDKLIKVADFFNVSVDYLLGRDNKNTPTEPRLDEGTRKLIDAILALPTEKKKALADLIGIDYK